MALDMSKLKNGIDTRKTRKIVVISEQPTAIRHCPMPVWSQRDKVVGNPKPPKGIRRREVHALEYGSHAYGEVHTITAANGRVVKKTIMDGGPVYTVFTKDANCGRGDYAEEIDVEIAQFSPRNGSLAKAKRIAAAVLAAEYQPGLRISKVVRRYGW